MNTKCTRVSALVVGTLVFALVIVPLFAIRLDFLHGADNLVSWLARILFFERFYLDFLVFLLIGVILVNGPWWSRVVAYVWWLLFAGGYILQWMSVNIGGEFVSFLAVDNINHASLLLNLGNILGVCVIGLALIAMVLLVERYCRGRIQRGRLVLTIGFVLALGLALQFHEKWIPGRVLAATESLHLDQNNRVGRRSPIESFYKVLFDDRSASGCVIGEKEVSVARRYGIQLEPNRRYPLLRDRIYRTQPPYKGRHLDESLNVIVFFSEGLSARTLDPYDALIPGLTPNLDAFAQNAMRVDNYYNHTYATYRGLHGQLCSLFPLRGGHGGWHTHYGDIKHTAYLCLNNLFSDAGYHTVFLDTHRRDEGFIDEMMDMLGFDQVINAEDVPRELTGGEPLRPDALSDNQLMNGLVGMLDSGELSRSGKPFFLALYNLETHAWQDVATDGVRFGDGNHPILNSIHNFDHAFGRFWSYFRESPYSDNTVVVFTADHAHYNDDGFVQLARTQTDYRPYFVDRIPMMIYLPGGGLPSSFDASRATSIDFAPSMAHFFGLENRGNPFLGHSIFDERRAGPENRAVTGGVAAAGDRYFVIEEDGPRALHWDDPALSEEQDALGCVIRTTWELESHDRLWPRQER